MRLSGIDHVVIYAKDIDRTIDFYTRVLGMTHVLFDDGCHALHFGQHKINIHDVAAPFEPHAKQPRPAGFDACLLTDMAITDVLAHLGAHNVDVIEGPCIQTGARGPMVSVYFNDPDGNLIEIANYDPIEA